jgi:hypothetical protein
VNTEVEEATSFEAVTRIPMKIANWEDLVHAVVNCIVCELDVALEFFVVTIYKSPLKTDYKSKPRL